MTAFIWNTFGLRSSSAMISRYRRFWSSVS